ncbi:MAG: GAF domain-containing protein [Bacteroidales bacterium]|nr:GAF domain-containing protein [Bacteroidales bacterium]
MAKKQNILSSYNTRVILSLSLILAIILGLASYRTYKLVKKNSSQKVFSDIQTDLLNSTYDIKSVVDNNAELVSNLSVIVSSYDEIVKDNRRTFFENTLKKIIEDNNEVYSIWTVFKPYTIDDLDDFYGKPFEAITGQFCVNYNRENQHIGIKKEGPEDYKLLDKYIPMFNSSQQVIIDGPLDDPYWQLSGRSDIIRIVAPILNKNNVVGLLGIDINLNSLISIINKAKFNVFLVDDDLFTIYSNDDNSIISKNLKETYPYVVNNSSFLKSISSHQSYSEKSNLFHPNQVIFYSTYPIYFNNARKYWTVIFYQEEELIDKQGRSEALKIFITPILVFLVILIIILIVSNNLNTFFKETVRYTKILSKGGKIEEFRIKRKNTEMKEIQVSLLEISNLLENTKKLSFEVLQSDEIDVSSELSKNPVSKNLVKISKKFNEEKEKREEQTKQQEIINLVSKAVADINNIQREYITDLEELAYETIKYITGFTDAVQGGFYIINSSKEEVQFLNLIAFYSYNRRIYNKKEIEIGDGLAGTCAQEKKSIYTTVPDNYLEITSGLGKTPPKYIFLLPLVIHDSLYGIIEIAFLEKLKNHQLQFLESVSEIIASTISTAETNSRTRVLLEQTQKITDEMREKEELMNSQIRELEELKNRSEMVELDRTAVLNTINKLTYYGEFDISGNVLSINKNLSEKIQIQIIDALMLTYYDILFVNEVDKHQAIWEQVLEGKTVEYEHNVSLGKFNFWFSCTLAPVYNSKEEVYKVIFFAIDYTEIKKKEKEMKTLMVEINDKAEQISVQEQEMDEFFVEFQNATEELENLNKKLADFDEQKLNAEKSLEFLQKEFQKRAVRSKRIEMNLKKKIKSLEIEIEFLKENNK